MCEGKSLFEWGRRWCGVVEQRCDYWHPKWQCVSEQRLREWGTRDRDWKERMSVHEEVDSIQRKGVPAQEGISPCLALHAQGSLARFLERDAVR